MILKVPDTIFQELFTESKKLALLFRSDTSKLTPTRTFSGKRMGKSRKISKNPDFFVPKMLSFWLQFSLKTLPLEVGAP